MSQGTLAKAIGVSWTTISAYECKGMIPTLPIALNIVDVLKWSISDWEGDARRIFLDNSWRRDGRRGKEEHSDDYYDS